MRSGNGMRTLTGQRAVFFLQAAEPQTLAYALTDSPVGWLAWNDRQISTAYGQQRRFSYGCGPRHISDERHSLLGYRHRGLRHANLSREPAYRRGSGADAAPGDSRGVRGFSEGGSCPSVSLDYSNIQRSTKN